MSTYLYRAVNAEPITVNDDMDSEPEVIPSGGLTFGRQSGYLSRSSAVSAGMRSPYAFEIIRSEPVMFLTRAEKIQKQINELHAELARLEEVAS